MRLPKSGGFAADGGKFRKEGMMNMAGKPCPLWEDSGIGTRAELFENSGNDVGPSLCG
jgi:hypothetical protein